MSVSSRDTIIKLCNCYDMDINHQHIPLFKTKDSQKQFFDQRTQFKLENTSYKRKHNSIKVDKPIEELKWVNYVVALNSNGEHYYYFVTDKVALNDNASMLILKLDVMQMYMFDYDLQSCLIERQHEDRWYYYQGKRKPNFSRVEENLEVGEYELIRPNTVYDYTDKGVYFITSSDMLGISDDERPKKDDDTGGGGETGEWISKDGPLTIEEMKTNASNIWAFFKPKGWTLNAVSAMLGNMQSESSINPGRWESDNVGNMDNGFGLVQWTPARNYIDWAGTNYKEGTRQCERIIYELENGIQWYATSSYDLTFEEFSKSTLTPRYLAMAFINNYERPLDTNQPIRGDQAEFWYNYLK